MCNGNELHCQSNGNGNDYMSKKCNGNGNGNEEIAM